MKIKLADTCGGCFEREPCLASKTLAAADAAEIDEFRLRNMAHEQFGMDMDPSTDLIEPTLSCPGRGPNGECQIRATVGQVALSVE